MGDGEEPLRKFSEFVFNANQQGILIFISSSLIDDRLRTICLEFVLKTILSKSDQKVDHFCFLLTYNTQCKVDFPDPRLVLGPIYKD